MVTELTSEVVKDYGINAGASVVGIAASKDFGLAPDGFKPTDVLPECLSVIVLGTTFTPDVLADIDKYSASRNEMLTTVTDVAKKVEKQIKASRNKTKVISAAGGKWVDADCDGKKEQFGYIIYIILEVIHMIEKLACKLGRNDEIPNIELAEYLCQKNDIVGIKEIVDGFKSNDKAVANDCIKVLYEIGERNPKLISSYADDFLSYLHSKNNRLAWGSMTALAKIAEFASEPIFSRLHLVISAYERGSVITVDNSITVFAKLCAANDEYAERVLPILKKHLQQCKPKEIAQHAERASICFNSLNANEFIKILEKRTSHLSSSQQKRVTKLLKKLHDFQR